MSGLTEFAEKYRIRNAVVHGHGSVALSDGSVKGGHWWEAHVSIVAIVFVTEEEDASAATK